MAYCLRWQVNVEKQVVWAINATFLSNQNPVRVLVLDDNIATAIDVIPVDILK